MKSPGRPNLLALFLSLVVLALAAGACERSRQTIRFGGGAEGGTIQRFAEAVATVVNQGLTTARIKVEPSGGANINLTGVNEGKLDMSIVYGSQLIPEGKEKPPPTESVTALARLYGPAAQLVVMAGSPIQTPYDLVNQRVAIGPPGSASAIIAQRYFRSLGIWDEIIPLSIGPSQALKELSGYEIGAVWQVIGFPSDSFRDASRQMRLRLIDLLPAAEKGGFFQTYPFYVPARIPAGTYEGQGADVVTFQDSAIWVANRNVDEDLAYAALKFLFSESSLRQMRSLHPVARDLEIDKAYVRVGIPYHPGAMRYWMERFPEKGL